MRVSVADMVQAKVGIKSDIVTTGAGGLIVGDWVDVTYDFSPGHNSSGGVGVIIEIVQHLSNVRYVVDSHVEKYIPLTRLTMIPMPFRRDKAKLRTRSAIPNQPSNGKNYSLLVMFRSICNLHCSQCQFLPKGLRCGVV
jgi:hypothetical protein